MVPFFLGQETLPSVCMTSSQKCLRIVDSVGDARHITFFEMLGNFSAGDYFKRDAISFAWELLTGVYRSDSGLTPEWLYPTVFPADEEAIQRWTKITGMPAERVVRLADNWWDRGFTALGPCGPISSLPSSRNCADHNIWQGSPGLCDPVHHRRPWAGVRLSGWRWGLAQQ